MKTIHCDIWENNVTSFCDDIDASDNDEAVNFSFADHDVDTFEYVCEPDEKGYSLCC